MPFAGIRSSLNISTLPSMEPPPSQQNTPTPQSAQTSPLHDEDCAFCQIITAYPVVSPLESPQTLSETLNPEKLHPPAFVLLSTQHVVAFLDIFPLVRGHVLLCPRRHAEKVGDMTSREGMEVSLCGDLG
jgi:galactose-1-phosphate uridylyltransferase